MQKPKVVIVFLNYNGVKIKFRGTSILKQSLDSLKKTTYKDYKIVAIDNGSNDSSKSVLRQRGIETINIKRNIYNFSRVNNIGARYAIKKYKPKYILFYSNDVFVKDPNWLTEVVKVADAEKDAGIVTCKIIYTDCRLQSLGFLFV
jgi:GT2 family glycosyltransferase